MSVVIFVVGVVAGFVVGVLAAVVVLRLRLDPYSRALLRETRRIAEEAGDVDPKVLDRVMAICRAKWAVQPPWGEWLPKHAKHASAGILTALYDAEGRPENARRRAGALEAAGT